MKKSVKFLVAFLGLVFLSFHLISWMRIKKVKGDGNITTKNISLSTYDKIEISGAIGVILFKGKEGSAEVTTDNNIHEFIELKVQGGKLILKSRRGYHLKPTQAIEVRIPVEQISQLHISGSGSFKSEAILDTNDLDLHITGSGNVSLPVEGTTVKASISGSGDMYLKGTVEKCYVSISGSGNFFGKELTVNNAEASISGSGNIQIDVKEMLKARVSGSGGIRFKSKPNTIDFKSSGSGTVRSL